MHKLISTLTAKNIKIGYAYFFIHLIVEIATFQFLIKMFSNDSSIWLIAIAFDVIAFMPQALIGAFIDKHGNIRIGEIGAILMILGISLAFFSNHIILILGLIILSLGNAAIHIAGGVATMSSSESKLTHSALFLAGGPFGLIIGKIVGANASISLMLSIILLINAIVIMILTDKTWILKKHEIRTPLKFDLVYNRSIYVVALLTFMIIFTRGFIAYGIPTSWIDNKSDLIIYFVFLGFGKALGGILSDIFNPRKIGLISVLISIPLLIFGDKVMVISLLGAMAFSMTAPITIGILGSVLKKNPGFAFGITTIALILGSLMIFMFEIDSNIITIILIVILSIFAFFALNYLTKKEVKI